MAPEPEPTSKKQTGEADVHHLEKPPGGSHAPYLWRITLADGTVLVRGDKYKGKVTLSPTNEHVRELIRRMELLPSNEYSLWKGSIVELGEGEALDYGQTVEYVVVLATGKTKLRTVRAVRLGAILPSGEKRTVWSFPDGRQLEHAGTYEDIVNNKL